MYLAKLRTAATRSGTMLLLGCLVLAPAAWSIVAVGAETKNVAEPAQADSEHPYPLAVQGPHPKPIEPPTAQQIAGAIE
ncbi:MAG: hypothetical protein AAF961_08250, partial [Planctomycetota bacterium]